MYLSFFPINYLEPPSFVLVPESQAVIPNTTVRFKSTFKGTPPFTVKWFKDDTELICGPSCFTGLEGLSCFLDLFAVGISHGGTYSCQISNDAGTAKCSTTLLVKGWTSFQVPLLTFFIIILFSCFTIYIFLSCFHKCLSAFHHHLTSLLFIITLYSLSAIICLLPSAIFFTPSSVLHFICYINHYDNML